MERQATFRAKQNAEAFVDEMRKRGGDLGRAETFNLYRARDRADKLAMERVLFVQRIAATTLQRVYRGSCSRRKNSMARMLVEGPAVVRIGRRQRAAEQAVMRHLLVDGSSVVTSDGQGGDGSRRQRSGMDAKLYEVRYTHGHAQPS